MSIFGKIKDAIFVRRKAKEAAPASRPHLRRQARPPAHRRRNQRRRGAGRERADLAGRRRGGADERAAQNKQKLDWRSSIVDLMKLLDLDSSLAARKELAKELGYTGDMDDSASMNIWLHKQVMTKLAANGGKVPDDLKA